MNTKNLPKAYEPKKYEDDIYREWEDSGCFRPQADKSGQKKPAKPYTIVMPPPNRTGVLHMGHAAMLAIEDILIRYHRMKGERALWVPGTDHAAIATQTKVEKIIKQEGSSRHELGKENFLKRVRQFAQDSRDTIVGQIKKMGCSCDWSREAYTLDEVRSQAVKSVFKMMHDDGLIYRGERIVNWCPRCHSTLADDEVEYKAQNAKLYTFKYSPDFPFAIATTRPETKLGDTAVAVNPKDKRYQKYIGQAYAVDFAGVKLKLKIIADRNIEMDFGTGALGVTPAHSAVDWQMAEDNNLDIIKVISEDGKIHQGFGKYSGLDVLSARKKIVQKLRQAGLMEKEEEFKNNLSLCYRCDTPIEPLPSKQWFIDVNRKIKNQKFPASSAQAGQAKTKDVIAWEGKSIKDVCLEVVREGKIKIVPRRFEKNYFHWIENLRDWCISRQIWFGHRVPVWYRSKKSKAGSKKAIELNLVRHAQTDWNINGIMQGQTDIPLNQNGREQARELVALIEKKNIDTIIISPLKRTRETAEILNTRHLKIIEDERLKERYYGKFEGMKTEEILKDHPEITTFEVDGCPYWIDVPTAETYDQLRARVKEFLADVKAEYAGKNIMVVSHGDTLDMFYAELNNLSNHEAYGKFSQNGRVQTFTVAGQDEEIYVGLEAPEGGGWRQDEDTLDTWFSSGLWTFSTLAREPEQIKLENGRLRIDSDDFKTFHPTQVLETGYDILFFWVARMIIMTTYAVGDIPFEDVYLHGLVRDEQGRKMSKSLGNVIDPLDMIAKYGTDATRLSLVIGTTPGNDMNLSEEKIAGYRNFVNKLWNVSRFIMQQCHREAEGRGDPVKRKNDSGLFCSARNSKLSLADKWILSKLNKLIKEVTNDLDNYRFSQAGEKLRTFTWEALADWYLEVSKFEKENKPEVLNYVLQNLLKLWHPFIPFVTEAIWKELTGDDLIMISAWPAFAKASEGKSQKNKTGFFADAPSNSAGRQDDNDENSFELVIEIIKAIRNARAENNVEPAKKIKAVIYAGKDHELIKPQAVLIKSLRTGIEDLEIKEKGKKIEDAIAVNVNGIGIYLIGAIDKEKEKTRLEKEINNLEKAAAASDKKLGNKEFIANAPEKVVSAERKRLDDRKEEIKNLKKRLEEIGN